MSVLSCYVTLVMSDCLQPCGRTVVRQGLLSMGILQARILEWVAMPAPRGSSWPRHLTRVSFVSSIGRWGLYCWCHLEAQTNVFCCSVTRVLLSETPWTAASQASLSFLHHLLELAQTHVRWVSDAIQPSRALSSPSPAFSLSLHQGLS